VGWRNAHLKGRRRDSQRSGEQSKENLGEHFVNWREIEVAEKRGECLSFIPQKKCLGQEGTPRKIERAEHAIGHSPQKERKN
jgi:hypothetical protein